MLNTLTQQSDYAHIVAAIDLEIEAMRNAAKFAVVARHHTITSSYYRIGYHMAGLLPHVGPERAAAIFFERLDALS